MNLDRFLKIARRKNGNNSYNNSSDPLPIMAVGSPLSFNEDSSNPTPETHQMTEFAEDLLKQEEEVDLKLWWDDGQDTWVASIYEENTEFMSVGDTIVDAVESVLDQMTTAISGVEQ